MWVGGAGWPAPPLLKKNSMYLSVYLWHQPWAIGYTLSVPCSSVRIQCCRPPALIVIHHLSQVISDSPVSQIFQGNSMVIPGLVGYTHYCLESSGTAPIWMDPERNPQLSWLGTDYTSPLPEPGTGTTSRQSALKKIWNLSLMFERQKLWMALQQMF